MITIEDLKKQDSVIQAIEFAQDSLPNYPTKPEKPFLMKGANYDQVLEYAELLKEYENGKELYEDNLKNYRSQKMEVDKIIMEYILDEAGIEYVPAQYREKVISIANEEGGFYPIYLELDKLISIFI